MAIYHHQDTVRALPGGAGQSGATVSFKLVSDDSEITTATTDANGFFQKSLADTATSGESSYVLAPGPYYTETTVGSYTRRHSSVSIGKAGPLDLAAQIQLNRALGTGLISDPANSLDTGAVTADGADMTVDVATFAAVIEGIPVWNDAARALDIGANATGSTRIDTVVVEMIPAGNATEGKCTLKVVEGTTSQPTLTQDTTTWQFPLANVSVANGASTIALANITDRRDYVERSTTAVESDVAGHETRITALEAGGTAVPRVAFIAYYQAAWNPPSIPANDTIFESFSLTFLTGYSDTEASDVFLMSHRNIDIEDELTRVITYDAGGDNEARVIVRNHTGSALNPASSTLTILVYRLVLA